MSAPEWFCPPGHPRTAQLNRDWQLRRVPLPVDVTDEEAFPEMALAREHARKLRDDALVEGR